MVSTFVAAALQDGGLPFTMLVAEPVMVVAWTAALFVTGLVSILLFTCAAQRCPAAASATIDTATRMISGYAAQVALFAASLDVTTGIGALCMFASVAIMALLQPRPDEEDTSSS